MPINGVQGSFVAQDALSSILQGLITKAQVSGVNSLTQQERAFIEQAFKQASTGGTAISIPTLLNLSNASNQLTGAVAGSLPNELQNVFRNIQQAVNAGGNLMPSTVADIANAATSMSTLTGRSQRMPIAVKSALEGVNPQTAFGGKGTVTPSALGQYGQAFSDLFKTYGTSAEANVDPYRQALVRTAANAAGGTAPLPNTIAGLTGLSMGLGSETGATQISPEAIQSVLQLIESGDLSPDVAAQMQRLVGALIQQYGGMGVLGGGPSVR